MLAVRRPQRSIPRSGRKGGEYTVAHYIVTGTYTQTAMKGMIARPSDREQAARGIIEAGGGKIVLFLLTTGETDFLAVVEAPSTEGLLSSLLVIGASGAVAHLKTQQAFTSAEFMQAQKRSAAMVSAYMAPT